MCAKDFQSVAYVAYSPIGHGWLVDDFLHNSPKNCPKITSPHSPQDSGRQHLQEPRYCSWN
ncbi:hypothetical protein BJ878DRAFT_491506 [Calycina marina]|uniref:Uncharacterized protein n=1 Tax=Calycina marina TaxID=1763456 RepID=A0A9P7ZA25_9HELO|nr:hypothetical protein BJ878DRAFT_491506 [Calycina marina]